MKRVEPFELLCVRLPLLVPYRKLLTARLELGLVEVVYVVQHVAEADGWVVGTSRDR